MANINKVHVAYLVPSDRLPTGPENQAAMETSIKILRQWYYTRMGNGKTFTLTDPIVEVIFSSHPAEWFGLNPHPPDAEHFWFRANAREDMIAHVGAAFTDPHNDWLVFLDADPRVVDGEQQIAGGNPGFALEWSKSIAAITGNDPDWSQCRGFGGNGHELGHSFDIHHPPGPPNPEWSTAIMGVGYQIFGTCILTVADKVTLNASPFFAVEKLGTLPPALCPFV